MGDALTPDDQMAVAWAFTTGSPTGRLLRGRVQRGEEPITDDDLVAIRQEWETAGRPGPEHHVHRDPVELADGTTVIAVSFFEDDPYGRAEVPSFGLYLDARWAPPWPHEHFAWPDLGVPAETARLRAALEALLARARRGAPVEIGCLGGHGRTGTALACLAVMTGTPSQDAVGWVRAHYCPDAVETHEQQALVAHFDRVMGDQRRR